MKKSIHIVIIIVVSIGILLISPNRDQSDWYMDEYGVIPTSQSAVSPFKQATSRYQYNQYANFNEEKGLIDPLSESNITGSTSFINTNNKSKFRETQFTQNFTSTTKAHTTNKLSSSGGGNSGLVFAWGKGGSQGQTTSGGSTHFQTWNEGNSNYSINNRQDNWPLLAPPFEDYIEGDITHPGDNPIDTPLFNVPVGEGYMILFGFGLLFLIGKVGFMRRVNLL